MFEDLLKYEKNKKITDEDIVEVKKIIAADKMKFTYFQLMHEKQNDFKDRERFENMRFYYLNLNKIINYLQVSFLNVYYYQKIYNSISSREKLYRLSDVVFYEELYFYYFFIMVDNIFKIIDKTGILLNDCLNLEIKREDNKFNILLVKEMEKLKNDSTVEINNYLQYMSNYDGSTFDKMKRKYRNQNTHNFTSEVPKYRIVGDQITFDDNLKIDKTFEDLLSLLNELNKYIKLVDQVVIYSIKIQGCD